MKLKESENVSFFEGRRGRGPAVHTEPKQYRTILKQHNEQGSIWEESRKFQRPNTPSITHCVGAALVSRRSQSVYESRHSFNVVEDDLFIYTLSHCLTPHSVDQHEVTMGSKGLIVWSSPIEKFEKTSVARAMKVELSSDFGRYVLIDVKGELHDVPPYFEWQWIGRDCTVRR